MSGIYIHIPFCRQACSYCDFYFVTRQQLKEPFIENLLREIQSYRDTSFVRETVETVYIGGGTPSLLTIEELKRIFDTLDQVFDLSPVEVTLEMNPDDVSETYLEQLRDLGINRASMGVQSFQPGLLDNMHRAHDRNEALECLELLSVTGFETYSTDLIYGNPGQTMEELEEDLEILLDFDPPHVSAYSLTIEPNTRLGKQVELGRIDPPADDAVAEQFDLVIDTLDGRGLRQYEVSNFSKPGYEAVHNSRYWNHANYLGLGPAAHSFWWNDEGARRWENPADVQAYIEKNGNMNVNEEVLGMGQLAEERLMLGLRTREGVGITELENRYGYIFNEKQIDYLQRKQSEGLVNVGESLSLTRKGLKIADLIILDLVSLKRSNAYDN